jgi:2-dehydro-3-deoxyphosphooctonate aldolase (KDO 8-P synthase)
MAGALKDISQRFGIPLIFKSSFLKANRTSVHSYTGPGLERGLHILQKVKRETGLTIISDVHSIEQVGPAASVLDVIQIPAFLCRQTDLLRSAAKTTRVINVKKGQFLAPWDAQNIVEKIRSEGNDRLLLTERGTTFGYNNLVVDMRSLEIMKGFDVPVVFDATHSVQLPGGGGTSSGGQREFVPVLARAAVAVRINALFLEVHDDPDIASCDGPNMISLETLQEMLPGLLEIDAIVKRG